MPSCLALSVFTLSAQDVPQQVFRQTVTQVLAPTTVTDKHGDFINGLRPQDFRVLDNGKPQDIQVDLAFHPISLVVCVQANNTMEGILPKIQKAASIFQPLVVGDQGEIALVAFDHRIRVMQDFTSDSTKFEAAMKQIKPGSTSSRMIDAVDDSIRMLKHRPTGRRRIILLISETRDLSSEGKLRDAMTDADFADVAIYSVDVSHYLAAFTSPPMAPRPDLFPPSAHMTPGGVPATPHNVEQTYGNALNSADFVPLFVEIFRAVKGIFVQNPVLVFTRYTGGKEYAFLKERGLERAVSDIGDLLHNQYLISYSPNNKDEGGFHQIQVYVEGQREAKSAPAPATGWPRSSIRPPPPSRPPPKSEPWRSLPVCRCLCETLAPFATPLLSATISEDLCNDATYSNPPHPPPD